MKSKQFYCERCDKFRHNLEREIEKNHQKCLIKIPSSLLENYELNSKIGVGGFGIVFKATNKLDEKICAIKLISFQVKDQTNEDLQDLLKEVRILSKLKHEYIINYITSMKFSEDNMIAIIMELAETSLSNIISNLSPQQMMAYTIQTSLGIEYLHCDKQIIHRDLKLDNLLILNNTIKISDFGLAKVKKNEKTTLSGFMGTQQYMAPELLNQVPLIDNKIDIWALGIIIHKIFTKGIHPFGANKFTSNIIDGKYNIDERIKNDKIIEILHGCFRKKPDKRFDIRNIIQILFSTTPKEINQYDKEFMGNIKESVKKKNEFTNLKKEETDFMHSHIAKSEILVSKPPKSLRIEEKKIESKSIICKRNDENDKKCSCENSKKKILLSCGHSICRFCLEITVRKQLTASKLYFYCLEVDRVKIDKDLIDQMTLLKDKYINLFQVLNAQKKKKREIENNQKKLDKKSKLESSFDDENSNTKHKIENDRKIKKGEIKKNNEKENSEDEFFEKQKYLIKNNSNDEKYLNNKNIEEKMKKSKNQYIDGEKKSFEKKVNYSKNIEKDSKFNNKYNENINDISANSNFLELLSFSSDENSKNVQVITQKENISRNSKINNISQNNENQTNVIKSKLVYELQCPYCQNKIQNSLRIMELNGKLVQCFSNKCHGRIFCKLCSKEILEKYISDHIEKNCLVENQSFIIFYMKKNFFYLLL